MRTETRKLCETAVPTCIPVKQILEGMPIDGSQEHAGLYNVQCTVSCCCLHMAFKRNGRLKLFGAFFALSFAMSLLFNAVVRETAETFNLKKN